MQRNEFKAGDIVTGIGISDYRKNHGDVNLVKLPIYGAKVLDEFCEHRVVVSYLNNKYLCHTYDIIKNESIQSLYKHEKSIFKFQTDRFKGIIDKKYMKLADSDDIESFTAIDNFKIIRYWTKNGLLHRENGPALIEVEADKTTEYYYINGNRMKNLLAYYIGVKNSSNKNKIKLSIRDIENLSNIPYDSIEINPQH